MSVTKIIVEARKQAEAAAQKELDEVKKQIQQEKEEAIRDIRRQVAVLSVDIAEKIIRKNLDEKHEQMEMIDRMLDEVLAASKKQLILKEMDIGIVSMRYAKALMEYAKSMGAEDTLYKEFCMLDRSFRKHPDLRMALENPILTIREKLTLICTAAVGGCSCGP